MISDIKPNCNTVPCTICFPGLDIKAQLAVRSEDGDVCIDLSLEGRQPFAALVLTLDDAIDLNLRLVGCAMRIRAVQVEQAGAD